MSDTVYFPAMSADRRRAIRFVYTNHRGETSQRKVLIIGVEYMATEWHPEPQWIMYSYDLEKKEPRSFAMRDMREVCYDV